MGGRGTSDVPRTSRTGGRRAADSQGGFRCDRHSSCHRDRAGFEVVDTVPDLAGRPGLPDLFQGRHGGGYSSTPSSSTSVARARRPCSVPWSSPRVTCRSRPQRRRMSSGRSGCPRRPLGRDARSSAPAGTAGRSFGQGAATSGALMAGRSISVAQGLNDARLFAAGRRARGRGDARGLDDPGRSPQQCVSVETASHSASDGAARVLGDLLYAFPWSSASWRPSWDWAG
jgi:hypothetical protein